MSIQTLLIGVDGATFTILEPLMAEGLMPNLQAFLTEGVHAPLRTIVPALTPPAWTSLMTGRKPGDHGIFDFFRRESADSLHIRFFNANDLQSETIWGLAAAEGLRITALNFPSMFPAPRLAGYVVPGWVPWRQLRLACWPENLLDTLKAIPGFNQRELAMDIKLEERTTEGCADPEEYGPWVQLHTRREQNWFEIFRHLTAQDPSQLTAVLFDGVDKLQHLCWRFLRPDDGRPLEAEWEFQVRDLCREYFRKLDGLIGEMCHIAGPQATVVLASDHGFGPTHMLFHVNSWLAQKGYLAWADSAAGWDTQGALHGVGQVARHTFMLDWSRTKVFAATPTSNGLYIVVNRDGDSPGVSQAEYQSFRQRLIEELMMVTHPETGDRVVSEIWTREQAFDGPCGELAPDLTLVLSDGGIVSILPSTETVTERPSVGGQHRPLGVFAMKGPGIQKGIRLEELSILDVAPAILHSLGLAIPEDLPGRVPEEIYELAALARKPVRKTKEKALVTAAAAGSEPQAMSAEDEQVVLERLRELGCIE